MLTEITQDQAADLIYAHKNNLAGAFKTLHVQTALQADPVAVGRCTPLAVKPRGWLGSEARCDGVYNRWRDAARSMLADIYSGRVDESVRFFVQTSA